MVIAITGCSGSGKTMLSNVLSKKLGANIPVHTTTRAPRKEDNGFYKYVTKQRFLEMEARNEFFIASGDGTRYYGVESKELEKKKNDNDIYIIVVSIKDIEQLSKKSNVVIVMTKHKNYIRDYFRKGIIRKVGLVESVIRFFIYLYDYIQNYNFIKKYVSYIVVFEDEPSLIQASIDKISCELIGGQL